MATLGQSDSLSYNVHLPTEHHTQGVHSTVCGCRDYCCGPSGGRIPASYCSPAYSTLCLNVETVGVTQIYYEAENLQELIQEIIVTY